MLSQIITFSADGLDGFIITNSLVGLGLIIAIYALMSPALKDFLKRLEEEECCEDGSEHDVVDCPNCGYNFCSSCGEGEE